MSEVSRPRNAVGGVPFGQLPVGTRRRLLLTSALRLAVTAAVLLGAYFLLPFTTLGATGPLAAFCVGLLVLVVTITLQVRATLRAAHPALRAGQALCMSILMFMVLFATTHFLIDGHTVGSYSQTMTRIDALYFTTTVLATVGFGDIAPVSELARTVTMFQMLGGLILLGTIAKVLLGAARGALDQRRS